VLMLLNIHNKKWQSWIRIQLKERLGLVLVNK